MPARVRDDLLDLGGGDVPEELGRHRADRGGHVAQVVGEGDLEVEPHAHDHELDALGADTVYQAAAEVETRVPSTYARLCKMYVRWGRSATREGLREDLSGLFPSF